MYVCTYRISPSIGAVKSLSASSCNIIKQQLFIDCTTPGPVTNRLYWVQGMQVYNYIAVCLEYNVLNICTNM